MGKAKTAFMSDKEFARAGRLLETGALRKTGYRCLATGAAAVAAVVAAVGLNLSDAHGTEPVSGLSAQRGETKLQVSGDCHAVETGWVATDPDEAAVKLSETCNTAFQGRAFPSKHATSFAVTGPGCRRGIRHATDMDGTQAIILPVACRLKSGPAV